MTKKTVGSSSLELISKIYDNTHSADEQMREQLTDYDANIGLCIEEGKKNYSRDFYIVVLTKKERLMPNVLRNYFISRSTCPSPEWDQTVYRYHKKSDEIEFLWVVPSKDTCEYFLNNPLIIDKSERPLLNFVLNFQSGNLLQLAKQLNNEQPDSPLLIN